MFQNKALQQRTEIGGRNHPFVALIAIAIAIAVPMTLAGQTVNSPARADPLTQTKSTYAWQNASATRTLKAAIPPPAGFKRIKAAPGSFKQWLRGLPMKPSGAPVLLYTGERKWRQDVHVAVIDIDVGKRDLQQCADAVMRLRTEWLWSTGQSNKIAFNYTGGGRVPFSRWARGERPSETGKRWRRRGKRDASYKSLRKYMIQVFAYAGTYSLSKELKTISPDDMRVGDVFIKGGFPGHAILVADMVQNPRTKEKRFLLLQSYMPAQEMHILKNPKSWSGSPWYEADVSWPFQTPEWRFEKGSLKRWP